MQYLDLEGLKLLWTTAKSKFALKSDVITDATLMSVTTAPKVVVDIVKSGNKFNCSTVPVDSTDVDVSVATVKYVNDKFGKGYKAGTGITFTDKTDGTHIDVDSTLRGKISSIDTTVTQHTANLTQLNATVQGLSAGSVTMALDNANGTKDKATFTSGSNTYEVSPILIGTGAAGETDTLKSILV